MQRGFQLDLFSPSLFVFYNREHNKLKILFWNTMELGCSIVIWKGGHSNGRAAAKEYLIRCRKRSYLYCKIIRL
ncbi:IS66 family insertion sequence element accessory protein TnpB [Paenibacillus alvei]|uniref:IS66 family insertion sequence element accessory protein TnpB n=1 Tax=Paenibacillus alvei TaxID=44250 RepID=UPI003D2CD8CA